MAPVKRLALATSQAHPELYGDEQALPAAFAAAGVAAQPVVWSDPAVDWTGFDGVILRSTWDYVPRITEFAAWLGRLEARGVRLANPASLVRWNLDKRYLGALERRGVEIVPTRFVAAGERVDLAALARELGWPELVLKPAISASAGRTHRFAAADAAALQPALDEITRGGAALVQPFMPEIATDGEWSLLFFGGAYSHAVLKRPRPGDFRVQTELGGSVEARLSPPWLRQAAQGVLAALPEPPAYARIDGVVRDGRFLLMEAELIEPWLFLGEAPGALGRYVRALTAFC